MNVNDIIALARAGFTAQQISAIAQAVPAVAAPAAPAAPAVAAPAAPAVAAPAAPVPAAPAAPAPEVPAAPQQPDFFNQLLSKIDGLTTTMQANAIMNSNQPAHPTEQDILAEIICPPIKKE